ncbi:hypothetical protein CSUI_005823 [Cystoisospora suis]|uniref:Uncharacterized protein n=1 Tax=Cystoisospora suis TaxID=483139 RepID=A0A2C6KSH1_9APIC|nr:hypothetical protein CSUI_005823 [Cystoisospora suis]
MASPAFHYLCRYPNIQRVPTEDEPLLIRPLPSYILNPPRYISSLSVSSISSPSSESPAYAFSCPSSPAAVPCSSPSLSLPARSSCSSLSDDYQVTAIAFDPSGSLFVLALSVFTPSSLPSSLSSSSFSQRTHSLSPTDSTRVTPFPTDEEVSLSLQTQSSDSLCHLNSRDLRFSSPTHSDHSITSFSPNYTNPISRSNNDHLSGGHLSPLIPSTQGGENTQQKETSATHGEVYGRLGCDIGEGLRGGEEESRKECVQPVSSLGEKHVSSSLDQRRGLDRTKIHGEGSSASQDGGWGGVAKGSEGVEMIEEIDIKHEQQRLRLPSDGKPTRLASSAIPFSECSRGIAESAEAPTHHNDSGVYTPPHMFWRTILVLGDAITRTPITSWEVPWDHLPSPSSFSSSVVSESAFPRHICQEEGEACHGKNMQRRSEQECIPRRCTSLHFTHEGKHICALDETRSFLFLFRLPSPCLLKYKVPPCCFHGVHLSKTRKKREALSQHRSVSNSHVTKEGKKKYQQEEEEAFQQNAFLVAALQIKAFSSSSSFSVSSSFSSSIGQCKNEVREGEDFTEDGEKKRRTSSAEASSSVLPATTATATATSSSSLHRRSYEIDKCVKKKKVSGTSHPFSSPSLFSSSSLCDMKTSSHHSPSYREREGEIAGDKDKDLSISARLVFSEGECSLEGDLGERMRKKEGHVKENDQEELKRDADRDKEEESNRADYSHIHSVVASDEEWPLSNPPQAHPPPSQKERDDSLHVSLHSLSSSSSPLSYTVSNAKLKTEESPHFSSSNAVPETGEKKNLLEGVLRTTDEDKSLVNGGFPGCSELREGELCLKAETSSEDKKEKKNETEKNMVETLGSEVGKRDEGESKRDETGMMSEEKNKKRKREEKGRSREREERREERTLFLRVLRLEYTSEDPFSLYSHSKQEKEKKSKTGEIRSLLGSCRVCGARLKASTTDLSTCMRRKSEGGNKRHLNERRNSSEKDKNTEKSLSHEKNQRETSPSHTSRRKKEEGKGEQPSSSSSPSCSSHCNTNGSNSHRNKSSSLSSSIHWVAPHSSCSTTSFSLSSSSSSCSFSSFSSTFRAIQSDTVSSWL